MWSNLNQFLKLKIVNSMFKSLIETKLRINAKQNYCLLENKKSYCCGLDRKCPSKADMLKAQFPA